MSKSRKDQVVGGVVHHALRNHWIVTDRKKLSAVLKRFPEGTEIELFISEKGEISRQWKPSDEQMMRLTSIVAALRKDFCDDMADFLASLYKDLQKLETGTDSLQQELSAECIPDSVKFEEGFKTGRELGFREGVASVTPAEWSEEEQKLIDEAVEYIKRYAEEAVQGGNSKLYVYGVAERLESLRPQPHWKPREEQKKARCSDVQSVVDIEKEYKTWWNSIVGKINVEHIMEWYMHETAHHFYELGLNARKEV